MMKGLTFDQLREVTEFVQTHHRFALYIYAEKRVERKKTFPKLPDSYGFGIKYIDSIYDSRDKTFWHIAFRKGNWGIQFSTNHWVNTSEKKPKDWKYDNLYDLCMDYLKGEFVPTESFHLDENKK